MPFGGEKVFWNKNRLKTHLKPFLDWASNNHIPKNRLVAGEFGCYRRNNNCDIYLKDIISIFNFQKMHWAFYSYREDEWDGYDYEVGTKGLGWEYWKAKEAGDNPKFPRKKNALFSVIENEFNTR